MLSISFYFFRPETYRAIAYTPNLQAVSRQNSSYNRSRSENSAYCEGTRNWIHLDTHAYILKPHGAASGCTIDDRSCPPYLRRIDRSPRSIVACTYREDDRGIPHPGQRDRIGRTSLRHDTWSYRTSFLDLPYLRRFRRSTWATTWGRGRVVVMVVGVRHRRRSETRSVPLVLSPIASVAKAKSTALRRVSRP